MELSIPQDNMEHTMPAVNSSAISFIEYNEATRVLTITVVKTGNYDYPNFPKSLYDEFISSKSKGTFYNRYIRDKF